MSNMKSAVIHLERSSKRARRKDRGRLEHGAAAAQRVKSDKAVICVRACVRACFQHLLTGVPKSRKPAPSRFRDALRRGCGVLSCWWLRSQALISHDRIGFGAGNVVPAAPSANWTYRSARSMNYL